MVERNAVQAHKKFGRDWGQYQIGEEQQGPHMLAHDFRLLRTAVITQFKVPGAMNSNSDAACNEYHRRKYDWNRRPEIDSREKTIRNVLLKALECKKVKAEDREYSKQLVEWRRKCNVQIEACRHDDF